MQQNTYNLGSMPQIVLDGVGRIQVIGVEDADIVTVNSSARLQVVSSTPTHIHFVATSDDIVLSVPSRSHVIVREASSDAVFQSILGSVEINEAHSNVTARHIGSLAARHIVGDLIIERLRIRSMVELVEGNLFMRRAQGDANIKVVNGNAYVVDAPNGIQIEQIGGSLTFNGALSPFAKHTFTTIAGEAHFRLLETATVRFVVKTVERYTSKLQPKLRKYRNKIELQFRDGQAVVSIDYVAALKLSTTTNPTQALFQKAVLAVEHEATKTTQITQTPQLIWLANRIRRAIEADQQAVISDALERTNQWAEGAREAARSQPDYAWFARDNSVGSSQFGEMPTQDSEARAILEALSTHEISVDEAEAALRLILRQSTL